MLLRRSLGRAEAWTGERETAMVVGVKQSQDVEEDEVVKWVRQGWSIAGGRV